MESNTQPRILVVEDDEKLLDLYKERLNAIGDFSVSTASSGPDAIERLDESLDLVLLDLNLPLQSGAEVLEVIEERDAEIPTVVISGREQMGDGSNLGDEFLQKPIHLEQFKRVVDKYLD
jgi:CheY-like chemotaxis protein